MVEDGKATWKAEVTQETLDIIKEDLIAALYLGS